jgi:signal peptidase II
MNWLRLRSAAIILLVIALDRISKLYVRAHISRWDMIPVIPNFFYIVHYENQGAAFSVLSDAPRFWRVFLLVGVSLLVMSVIGVMLLRMPARLGALTATSLAMVFGGAVGNVWDRIFSGTVTDFIDAFIGSYEFPAFNVADSAITIGAALMIIDLWRSRKRA